ncbi:HNH endonuclease [Aeromonas hydrophila]|uniref:HNH endonuclease n=1 Tax=Aeromonas hydrophila TaxID=644 RepID=UPI0038CFAEB5
MQLFFHDVGLKGANADFPKTIYSDIAISDIVAQCPMELRASISESLLNEFPDGWCNVWGVPLGAKSVINQLTYNDVMLLIKSTGGLEEIPVLCHVKYFPKEQLLELSKFLWGSTHFPYIFFFKTQDIDLNWTQFKLDVDYLPKFRPSGNVYRVKSERLLRFGGASGYVKTLLKKESISLPPLPLSLKESEIDEEYNEGSREVRETTFFKRNKKLVLDAKKTYGYNCQICDFNFEEKYGELGFEFIECHHINPLSERDLDLPTTIEDVRVVCSNCHKMLHKTSPALHPLKLKSLLSKK